MKTTIWVTTQFEGFHRWKDAPDEISYLRDFHRHIFHVKLGKEVKHDNREIEFISLKNSIDSYILGIFKGKKFEYSCEELARLLLSYVDGDYCEVSEDGENGARVEKLNIWGKSPLEEVFKREKEKKQNEDAIKMLDSMITPVTISKDPYQELKRKKDKIFVGIEAEGPHRGCKTLFIPGSVSYDRLDEVLKNLHDEIGNNDSYKAYLGAGNDSVLQDNLLLRLNRSFYDRNIIIEVESFNKLNYEIISVNMTLVSLNHLDKAKPFYNNSYIKYVEWDKGIITWVNYECRKIYTTLISDPFFNQDKEVE